MCCLHRFDGTSDDYEYKYNPCYPMNVDGYPGCSDDTAAVSIDKRYVLLRVHTYYMLNKNTLGVKKCGANQKQHASRQVRPKLKALIS